MRIPIGDCLLRPIAPSDRVALLRYLCIQETASSEEFLIRQTPAEIDTWLGGVLGHRPVWAFAIDTQGALIGQLNLDPGSGVRQGTAELGYWVAATHQGQGLATAATQAAVDYAFSRLKLARVEAHVDIQNAASIRVLEKAGFEREGCLRSSLLRHGSYRDQYVYAQIDARRVAPETPQDSAADHKPPAGNSIHRVAFSDIDILAPEEQVVHG